MVAEPVILECGISSAMASTQEGGILRRQLDELHCTESGSRENNGTLGVETAPPEDMRVGKPEPYAPGKDFDDCDFTFRGYAGTRQQW